MPVLKQAALPEHRRRDVFLALVLKRRKGLQLALLGLEDAARGREAVARRFSISDEQLTRIEQEGTTACWPPLD